jgi:hypothetical protein
MKAAATMVKLRPPRNPATARISPRWIALLWTILLIGLFATHSNHFQNSFHFDDSHTVQTARL